MYMHAYIAMSWNKYILVKAPSLCTLLCNGISTVASAVWELSQEGRGRDAIKREAQPSALSTSRPHSKFDNSCTARVKVF